MASQRRWWAFARDFQHYPLEVRKKVSSSRQLRSTYLRIARGHAYYGEALDELYAPLHIHVFVAYAPDSVLLPRAAGQRARFDAVMKYRDEHQRWPRAGALKLLWTEIVERMLGPSRATPEPGHAGAAASSATTSSATTSSATTSSATTRNAAATVAAQSTAEGAAPTEASTDAKPGSAPAASPPTPIQPVPAPGTADFALAVAAELADRDQEMALLIAQLAMRRRQEASHAAGTAAQGRSDAAEFALAVATEVAQRDPEMSVILVQLANRRRQQAATSS